MDSSSRSEEQSTSGADALAAVDSAAAAPSEATEASSTSSDQAVRLTASQAVGLIYRLVREFPDQSFGKVMLHFAKSVGRATLDHAKRDEHFMASLKTAYTFFKEASKDGEGNETRLSIEYLRELGQRLLVNDVAGEMHRLMSEQGGCDGVDCVMQQPCPVAIQVEEAKGIMEFAIQHAADMMIQHPALTARELQRHVWFLYDQVIRRWKLVVEPLMWASTRRTLHLLCMSPGIRLDSLIRACSMIQDPSPSSSPLTVDERLEFAKKMHTKAILWTYGLFHMHARAATALYNEQIPLNDHRRLNKTTLVLQKSAIDGISRCVVMNCKDIWRDHLELYFVSRHDRDDAAPCCSSSMRLSDLEPSWFEKEQAASTMGATAIV